MGVVNDIDYQDLKEKQARQVYLCATQGFASDRTVYLDVQGDPGNALSAARSLVQRIEPKAPVLRMITMENQVQESLATERMIASLFSGFTILAVALAVIGLYGVMAYMVAERAREIGIRVALGARPGKMVWLVMREVVWLVAGGVTVAVPLILGLARLVQSELYGISSADPASVAGAALVLSTVALLAGFLPARRAAWIGPVAGVAVRVADCR